MSYTMGDHQEYYRHRHMMVLVVEAMVFVLGLVVVGMAHRSLLHLGTEDRLGMVGHLVVDMVADIVVLVVDTTVVYHSSHRHRRRNRLGCNLL